MRVSQVLEQLSFLWKENTGYRKKGLCNDPRNICRKKETGRAKKKKKRCCAGPKERVGVIKTGSVLLKPWLKGQVRKKKKHRVWVGLTGRLTA